jgi:hypothetical protein
MAPYTIYFGDATLARAFVARWGAGYKIERSPGAVWRANSVITDPANGVYDRGGRDV